MTFPFLPQINVPAVRLLRLRWSPHFAPFKYDFDILTNTLNPAYWRTLDRFNRSPRDTLRWKFSTNMSAKALPQEVARKRLRRRWEQAFLKALEARGYDRRGKAMDKEGKRNLLGTLEAHVYGGKGFKSPFAELVGQAGAAIDAFSKANQEGEPSDGTGQRWSRGGNGKAKEAL